MVMIITSTLDDPIDTFIKQCFTTLEERTVQYIMLYGKLRKLRLLYLYSTLIAYVSVFDCITKPRLFFCSVRQTKFRFFAKPT